VLSAPEAVTMRAPEPPMMVTPPKSFVALETVRLPVPDLVRPTPAPVIFEAMIAAEVAY
jgi:hypothetical protein